MEELLYDVKTLASIIINRDMALTVIQDFLNNVWQYEKEYLPLLYKKDKKIFFYHVMDEVNYWQDKKAYDQEIKVINRDLRAIGSECEYISDDEFYELKSYFMELRLRMIYLDNQDYVRMKLRTLLTDHGYKRRSSKVNLYLKQCMYFYHIQTFVRGGELCDIEKIDLDDMMTFRVLESIRPIIERK